MRLNEVGQMVRIAWQGLSLRFPGIELDEFTVMPNHIHGILVMQSGDVVTGVRANTRFALTRSDSTIHTNGTLPNTAGRIIQAFKSMTTHEYIKGVKISGWPPFPGRLWQRNYWDHIVRNEADLHDIREYIQTNARRWELDKLFLPY